MNESQSYRNQDTKPRLAQGTELMGEEPAYLIRRGDTQVVQLSHLLYLVAAEADGHKDFEQIASRVSARFGRTVTGDNVRFLVEKKLRPMGVVAPAAYGSSLQRDEPGTAPQGMPLGISMSALAIAQARVKESARSDRLFEDLLAEAFVTAVRFDAPPSLLIS